MNSVGQGFRIWTGAMLLGSSLALTAMPGGAPWSGEGAQAASLQDAVQRAVTANPDVRALAADRRAIDHELRQARSGYYPQVDLRAATGWERTRRPSLNGTQNKWRSESLFSLKQLLFDGFATDNEVDRQKNRVNSAAHRVSGGIEAIGLDAVLAYLEVLRGEALVRIAQNNVRTHESTLADVRRLAAAGRGNIADVRQTESRVASSKASLVETQGILREAQASYQRVVGDAPQALSQPTFPRSAMPADREAAVGIALRNNPAINIANSDIGVSGAELESTKSPFYPRLDLELGTQHNENIDGVDGAENDYTAMVVLRYNLYSGGLDTARRKEFVERAAEAREKLDIARRGVAEDARLSWNAMITARGRSRSFRDQVKANEGVVAAYRQQFLIGQRDLLDLLGSQNELFIARSNLATSGFTDLFGSYRVLAAMGTLVSSLDLKRPKESMTIKAAKPAKKKSKKKGKKEKAKGLNWGTPGPASRSLGAVEPKKSLKPSRPMAVRATRQAPRRVKASKPVKTVKKSKVILRKAKKSSASEETDWGTPGPATRGLGAAAPKKSAKPLQMKAGKAAKTETSMFAKALKAMFTTPKAKKTKKSSATSAGVDWGTPGPSSR